MCSVWSRLTGLSAMDVPKPIRHPARGGLLVDQHQRGEVDRPQIYVVVFQSVAHARTYVRVVLDELQG